MVNETYDGIHAYEVDYVEEYKGHSNQRDCSIDPVKAPIRLKHFIGNEDEQESEYCPHRFATFRHGPKLFKKL